MATGGRLNLKNAIGDGPIICPEGEHIAQGERQCIEGIVAEDPGPYPDKPCNGSFTQGSDHCIAGEAVPYPGPYPDQPNCELLQGTNICIKSIKNYNDNK